MPFVVMDDSRSHVFSAGLSASEINGAGMMRTASNNSSTSSDIRVAPAPLPSKSMSMDTTSRETQAVSAILTRKEDTLLLVVSIPKPAWPDFLEDDQVRNAKIATPDTTAEKGVDADGPNARGTYPKAYTLHHPEIEWVHRGQGRYLPAGAVPVSQVIENKTRQSIRRQPTESLDLADVKSEARESEPSFTSIKPASSSPIDPRPRKRRALADILTDSLSTFPTYGLRHRPMEHLAGANESRAARLARRAHAVTSIETLDDLDHFRRVNSDQNDDDDSGDNEMEGDAAKTRDREETFTREYVDAHPDEEFHHTGNGWYKRGKKKATVSKLTKRRYSTEAAVTRESDGTLTFDPNEAIHGDNLKKYPGAEFHHCGNGWYKAGPSRTGKKSSIIVPPEAIQENDSHATMESNETVSKAYKEAHPEFEWEHRGNGRYKRKLPVKQASVSPSVSYNLNGKSKTEPTFSKAYVEAHSHEPFYHTGNGRYKRGNKPNNTLSTQPSEKDEDEDPDALYSKEYVQAHPELEFHHRGQGRYKRGPRPSVNSLVGEGHDDDAEDAEVLVDTDYVDLHPDEVFHHKGQGRWARGLPPPGSSNKVAVRGPGAKERMASIRSAEAESLDPENQPPGLTALVLRSEGPEKFPKLEWFYRGGGKWSRTTKQGWQKSNQRGNYSVGTLSKYAGKKRFAIRRHEAQLKRETAVGEDGERENGEGDSIDGEDGPDIPTPKRRRRGRGNAGLGLHLARSSVPGSKHHSSNEQSTAPTPRPRMLTEEEDRLAGEDLPPLYMDGLSDADSEASTPSFHGDFDDLLRMALYRPLTNPAKFVAALTKHDPQVRSLSNLVRLAENAQYALKHLQDEYLALERITQPHARVARKPVKGGRLPVDPAIFEDRKEADLYDYVFDSRRIGFQNPDAQRIVRDAEGRELRKRRQRAGVDVALPGWDSGDVADLAPKRASRQPTRFGDQQEHTQPARKRMRTMYTPTHTGSVTPDRFPASTNPAATNAGLSVPTRARPGTLLPGGYEVRSSGRWAGHIPKRIQQILREESVDSTVGGRAGRVSPGAKNLWAESGPEREGAARLPKVWIPSRKGRPKGSKNKNQRSDAGLKKGPRRPRVEEIEALADEGEDEGNEVDRVVEELD